MELQYDLNILRQLQNVGFRVTWRIVYIGLYGTDRFEPRLAVEDFFDFLKENINETDVLFEDFVLLLSSEGDEHELKKTLFMLTEKEKSTYELDIRKLRCLELINIFARKNEEYLPTSIYDFWLSYNSLSSDEISETTALHLFINDQDKLCSDSMQWLENEIKNIISAENALCF